MRMAHPREMRECVGCAFFVFSFWFCFIVRSRTSTGFERDLFCPLPVARNSDVFPTSDVICPLSTITRPLSLQIHFFFYCHNPFFPNYSFSISFFFYSLSYVEQYSIFPAFFFFLFHVISVTFYLLLSSVFSFMYYFLF